jgi:hypothetical protein
MKRTREENYQEPKNTKKYKYSNYAFDILPNDILNLLGLFFTNNTTHALRFTSKKCHKLAHYFGVLKSEEFGVDYEEIVISNQLNYIKWVKSTMNIPILVNNYRPFSNPNNNYSYNRYLIKLSIHSLSNNLFILYFLELLYPNNELSKYDLESISILFLKHDKHNLFNLIKTKYKFIINPYDIYYEFINNIPMEKSIDMLLFLFGKGVFNDAIYVKVIMDIAKRYNDEKIIEFLDCLEKIC